MSNGMSNEHHETKARQKKKGKADTKSNVERKQDQKRKAAKADTSKAVTGS